MKKFPTLARALTFLVLNVAVEAQDHMTLVLAGNPPYTALLPRGIFDLVENSTKTQIVSSTNDQFVNLFDMTAQCDPSDVLQQKTGKFAIQDAQHLCAISDQCAVVLLEPNKIILCKANVWQNPKKAKNEIIAFRLSNLQLPIEKPKANIQRLCDPQNLVFQTTLAPIDVGPWLTERTASGHAFDLNPRMVDERLLFDVKVCSALSIEKTKSGHVSGMFS